MRVSALDVNFRLGSGCTCSEAKIGPVPFVAAKADFGSFQKLIDKQVSKLQKKTGCKEVHLRVAREGDTLKLKAKPVREDKSS